MYRCETCSTLFRTPEAFGEACPVDGSDRRSLRQLWVALRCGDEVFRVSEFPFFGDRRWARTHVGAALDDISNPAYKYFPSDRQLFRVDEDDGCLRLFAETEEAENHVRVGDAPLPAEGCLVTHGMRLHVFSVRRGVAVMTLEVSFETFTDAL